MRDSNWSVVDVFGEPTTDRKGFEVVHWTRRRKYDHAKLSELKAVARGLPEGLEKQYVLQNIQIIQLARGVI